MLIERPSISYFSGFTLIELLVTISVIAILAVLGMPSMSGAINNAKVRSVTESLQNGLRIAQNEAIRRSHQTAFVLTNSNPAQDATPTANGKNWYVQVLPAYAGETVADEYVQGGSFGNVASGVTITSPVSVICFNSIGRVVANNSTGLGANCSVPGGASSMTTYDVTRTGADRTLRLQVTAAGKIRMCDTSRFLSTAQPDGC